MRTDVWLLAIALTAVLAWIFWRDQRRARAWRSGLLEPAASLIDQCERSLDPLGFPVLRGLFARHPIEVGLIVDAVAVRRLPSLWLSVTVKAPLPNVPTVDLLARAHNTEFYSPAERLPERLLPPADWPQHIQIKSDAGNADLASIAQEAADYFAEPRAKEMLITRRGVRLVFQLDQARRGDYLMLRSARFDTAAVAPEAVLALMQRAVALHARLRDEAYPLKHAA